MDRGRVARRRLTFHVSRPQLVIERDSNAASATLILPRDLSAGLKPSDTSRFAKAAPNALVGLALFGSLIAGGLWLARLPVRSICSA